MAGIEQVGLAAEIDQRVADADGHLGHRGAGANARPDSADELVVSSPAHGFKVRLWPGKMCAKFALNPLIYAMMTLN